jgi:hypothetical protein
MPMKKLPRNVQLEHILDRQMRLWESQRVTHVAEREPVRPNLTISRQPYAGAEELAERIASRLGWELYDRRIVELLHENDALGKSVLESLDERLLNFREDWLYHVFVPGHMSSAAQLLRLSRLVFSIAMRGHAVILGRGANFVVPPEHRLAVLVVRSFESRLQRSMQEQGVTHEAARRALARLDRERGEFILRSFHHDVDDARAYDMCLNLDALGVDGAEAIVLRALEARFPPLRQATAAAL